MMQSMGNYTDHSFLYCLISPVTGRLKIRHYTVLKDMHVYMRRRTSDNSYNIEEKLININKKYV